MDFIFISLAFIIFLLFQIDHKLVTLNKNLIELADRLHLLKDAEKE